jgi:acetylornithine deacetylase/succinyl-diaminopimelate desuccinylase-like protein
MTSWQTELSKNEAHHVEELLDLLRIPSISSLPAHAAAVQEAAEWVAARMRRAGIEKVEILPTGGHPVVYGEWLHAPDAPTVLVYGHFDTQPVDPLELWTHPPFEPTIEGDRIYARGASDDKGSMFATILATEALLQAEGKLPINVKFLFEGQEEIGSPQLPEFMAAQQDRYACDMAVSADGGQWAEDQPELTLATRGLCALQVDVTGPAVDMHSGIYGGTVQNPLHALAAILAELHDDQGRITVPGFYDSVHVLSAEEKAAVDLVPFELEAYRSRLGVSELFGEGKYSTHERAWVRPTLEINGMWGGFTDAGMKTVLPSKGHAKITCRLVPNQEPAQIAQLVADHIRRVAPPGVTVDVTVFQNAAMPYVVAAEHPGNQAAHAVLEELYGKAPYYTRTGGSVPLYTLFRENLGVSTVTFGFGLPDEQIHSPNEFWRLSSFRRARVAYAMLFHELAKIDVTTL